jgi:hypothetical protein
MVNSKLRTIDRVPKRRSAFLVYEKMRRLDAKVRAALLACELPAASNSPFTIHYLVKA